MRRGGDLEAAAGFVQMVAHGALDGPDLIVAARRLLERRPESVPLWWSAARLVMAPEPQRLAVEILDQWDSEHLAYADLDDDARSYDEPDDGGTSPVRSLTVVAVAGSTRRLVLEPGDADRVTLARLAGRRVLVEIPVGRSLDDSLLQCVLDATPQGRWIVSEAVPNTVVTHRGPTAPHSGGLLRRSAI